MKFFSKKVEGDLSLTYNRLAGFTLGWLPFSKRAIQMAFPHLDVKAEDVPSYGSGTEAGFGLYANDETAPAFTINQDGNTGYAYSIIAQNGQPLCIGKYRVGETRIADFRDDQLEEVGFWVDGSKITVFSGLSECGCIYNVRFSFKPPQDWSGDLTKASPEIWQNCILSEVLFYISERRIRPQSEIKEAEGIKLLKKQNPHKSPAPMKDGPNIEGGDPLQLLRRLKYSSMKAKNSYLKLADLAVYNAPIDEVKSNIKAIFKNHEDPYDVLLSLSEMYHHDFKTNFMFSLDWKADIIDLAKNIEFALGSEFKRVTLPPLDSFPSNKSVSLPGVFEAYAKSLGDAGFDLWFMDSQTDAHIALIANSKDRKRISKFLEPTQLHHSPM